MALGALVGFGAFGFLTLGRRITMTSSLDELEDEAASSGSAGSDDSDEDEEDDDDDDDSEEELLLDDELLEPELLSAFGLRKPIIERERRAAI